MYWRIEAVTKCGGDRWPSFRRRGSPPEHWCGSFPWRNVQMMEKAAYGACHCVSNSCYASPPWTLHDKNSLPTAKYSEYSVLSTAEGQEGRWYDRGTPVWLPYRSPDTNVGYLWQGYWSWLQATSRCWRHYLVWCAGKITERHQTLIEYWDWEIPETWTFSYYKC